MFYADAYPAAANFSTRVVEPAEARWDADPGEFLLPYRVVRESSDRDATLLRFLQTTYEAAATTGDWDRDGLECRIGLPGVPRTVG